MCSVVFTMLTVFHNPFRGSKAQCHVFRCNPLIYTESGGAGELTGPTTGFAFLSYAWMH